MATRKLLADEGLDGAGVRMMFVNEIFDQGAWVISLTCAKAQYSPFIDPRANSLG
jgi:hypothetical protein